jgi:hypothetical protein
MKQEETVCKCSAVWIHSHSKPSLVLENDTTLFDLTELMNVDESEKMSRYISSCWTVFFDRHIRYLALSRVIFRCYSTRDRACARDSLG